MDFKKFFYAIFKSLNPESYNELKEERVSFAIKYFFFAIMLSVIIMFILFIPSITVFPKTIDQASQNFERLDINFSFEPKQSFILSQDPLIRVSTTSANLTNERVLITPDAAYYKQFYYFGNIVSKPLNKDLSIQNPSKFRQQMTGVLFFILPSLFFWSTIFFAIYFIVIIACTFLLALIFQFIINRKYIPVQNLFKMAIYASTILILVQVILLPFYRLFIIPLVAYWLLFVIAILRYKDDGKMPPKTQGGKSRDVFANDTVDVDPQGNMKGRKRKKSYEEENEGYVEMK
jgi:hypothetical protein